MIPQSSQGVGQVRVATKALGNFLERLCGRVHFQGIAALLDHRVRCSFALSKRGVGPRIQALVLAKSDGSSRKCIMFECRPRESVAFVVQKPRIAKYRAIFGENAAVATADYQAVATDSMGTHIKTSRPK